MPSKRSSLKASAKHCCLDVFPCFSKSTQNGYLKYFKIPNCGTIFKNFSETVWSPRPGLVFWGSCRTCSAQSPSFGMNSTTSFTASGARLCKVHSSNRQLKSASVRMALQYIATLHSQIYFPLFAPPLFFRCVSTEKETPSTTGLVSTPVRKFDPLRSASSRTAWGVHRIWTAQQAKQTQQWMLLLTSRALSE